MKNIDTVQLRAEFARQSNRPKLETPILKDEWWMSIPNLDDVAPIIAEQWRKNRVACTLVLRRELQVDNISIAAVFDFGEWCAKEYPPDPDNPIWNDRY